MGLFYTGGGGGGEKYEHINDGFYIGELKEFEEGPVFTNDDGTPQPKVRWVWDLYEQTGNPVMHENAQATISELTSDKTGDKSTAAKWFTAHTRKPFSNRVDNVEATMVDCLNKRVNLVVSTKPTGYRKVDVFPIGSA